MENDIERFEINGFSVGIDDRDDVIEGKENDFISLCGELWDYVQGDFQNGDYLEADYIRLCDIYDDANIPYRLIEMDELNSYCQDNDIGVKDFLEYKDDNFDVYDCYFMDTNRYISGNCLGEFGDVETMLICVLRLIISRPIEFCRYQHDIEDPTLNKFIERFKECVKDKNYWCKE